MIIAGDGNLEITELVDNYKILAQHSVNCEELLDAFNRLDTNKDGFLNLLELKVSIVQHIAIHSTISFSYNLSVGIQLSLFNKVNMLIKMFENIVYEISWF